MLQTSVRVMLEKELTKIINVKTLFLFTELDRTQESLIPVYLYYETVIVEVLADHIY